MKTLNDILTVNCLRYKEIKTCQDCRYWGDCEGKKVTYLILQAVEEWLNQNRADIGNQIYSDHRVVAEAVFTVLMSRLSNAGEPTHE